VQTPVLQINQSINKNRQDQIRNLH
jgi:hypothetical protein